MGQVFSKCLGPREKRDKPLVVPATVTPNEPEVAVLPATLPLSGVASASATPSGVTVRPDETVLPLPDAALLPNENETAFPPSDAPADPNETNSPPSRERNFWEEALATLSEEYKLPEEWGKAEVFNGKEMLGLVTAKMEECEEKQWKIKINGKEVLVRDLFEKMLDWGQKFADVGEAAAPYMPVNAALPWAGIRSLLQVPLNDIDTYVAMAGALERAAWLTSYCFAHESLYKECSTDNPNTGDAFIEDLVQLYAAILRFLIQAFEYYAPNTAVRFLKSAIRPSTWVEELTLEINNRKRNMENHAILFRARSTNRRLKDLLGKLETISEYVSEGRSRREDKDRQAFLNWLSDVDYRNDQDENSRKILKDSGSWMLEGDVFCRWKEDGAIFWLNGIPGAGKTILTSTVIEHLMDSDKGRTVAYFYCVRDQKQPKKEDPEEILRAILKQLVIPLPSHLPNPVKAKYEKEKPGKDHGSIRRLTLEECADFIMELATDHPVTIVIDALDECREGKLSNGSHSDRQDILDQLERVATASNVKVFLSSRDDQDIEDRLRVYSNITISASKNGNDLQRFIKSGVADLMRRKKRSWGNDKELEGEIIKALDDRASGMFRLAALQIGYLDSLKTAYNVRQRLQKLPITLRELYGEIYGRIQTMEEGDSATAKRVLSWLLCARRQLRSSELLAAISPDPKRCGSEGELLDLCRHLVVLNKVSDSFELAHLTVREYLEEHEEYKDGQPHVPAAAKCMELLGGEAPQGILHPYASLYWAVHYGSMPPMEKEVLSKVVKAFFHKKGDNPAFKRWVKIARVATYELPWGDNVARKLRDTEYKPLSVVCVFGFHEILDQWTSTPPKGGYFQDSEMAVHLAINWGNAEVVHSLLQKDAQPAIDKYGWTPTFWAAIYEQPRVLEVLKSVGNVDAEDEIGWTALYWMVFIRHVEGLEILLKMGTGQDMADKEKWTPLHWAAFLGNETEAKLLVEGKARLDLKDNDGLTPFQLAKFTRHETIATLLKSEVDDGVTSSTDAVYLSQLDVRMVSLERLDGF